MKKLFFILLILSSTRFFSQTNPSRIELNIEDETITTTSSSGKISTKRVVNMYFSEGDGIIKDIGKKGKEIEKILIKDKKAYEEFKNYKKIYKKINGKKALMFVSYVGMVGGIAVGLISFTREEKNIPLIVAGGVVGVGGIIAANIFNKQIDKLFEDAQKSLKKSVDIYNSNVKS